jgi:GNAT superfamily N-acetyltransferase
VEIRIQPGITEDAAELAALHTAVAGHLTDLHGRGPWSARTSIKGVLYAMRTSEVFVARQQSEIVATFRLTGKKPWAIDVQYFTPCPSPLYLIAMAVAPQWQGRGIGRRCLQEADKLGATREANALRLDTYDASAGAGGFYASCGYREVGRATYRSAPLIYFERALNGAASHHDDTQR